MYWGQCLHSLRTKRWWQLATDCLGCCHTPHHDAFEFEIQVHKYSVGANWLRTVGFLWSKMVEFWSLFGQLLANFWEIDYDRSKGYFVNFTSNCCGLLRSSYLFNGKQRKTKWEKRSKKKWRFSPKFSLPSLWLSLVDDIRILMGENESKNKYPFHWA